MRISEIKQFSQCSKCPYKDTIIVEPFCQTTKPRFIVLGQSPGEQEINAGEPFVGPSGKLLIRMLNSIKVFKSELYITNAIKCMPTKNEDPKSESLVACKPTLLEEIKEVLPKCQHKLILAVGKVALKQLDANLGKKPIDSVVGSLIHSDELDCDIFTIRHPAALLRSASQFLYNQYTQHFIKLKQYLDDNLINYTLDDFTLIETDEQLAKLKDELINGDILTLDIETSTLKMWDVQILSIALYTGQKAYVIDTLKLDPTRFLESIKDKKIICHNAEFDIRMIDYVYNVRLNLYWDTMQAEHVLDEEEELGLKTLAIKYFNAPPYDAEISQYWKDPNLLINILQTDEVKRNEFYLYNARDTYYTYLLYQRQAKLFDTIEQSSYKFYQLFTLPIINTFLDIEKYGIPINIDSLYNIEKQLTEEIKQLESQLYEIVGQQFNIRSLPTLIKILQQYGLTDKDAGKTATGNISLTKEDLKKLQSREDKIGQIATLILAIRKNEKLISTYVRQIKEYIYENKYSKEIYGKPLTVVSPSFKVHASRTYRLNSENPNIHNINRGSIIRTLFAAPEGYSYFGADYKNAEAYLAAVIAKEQKLIDFILNPDTDQHRYTASVIYNKPMEEITKDERTYAKLGWFCLQYGGSEYAISRDFNLDIKEAVKLVQGIKRAYPNLFGYMDALKVYAKQQKKLVNRFGAVKRFPVFNNTSERQAINFPFQSEVSTYNHLSFIDLHKIATTVGLDKFRVLFTIHDSIDGIIRTDLIPIVYNLIKRVMTLPRKGMQLLVDIELGTDNWLTLQLPTEQQLQEIEKYKDLEIPDLVKLLMES